MEEKEHILGLRDYRKAYQGRTLLKIPELRLLPGIYWISGVNGSGKTTFFKSLAGMIPFEGSVTLSGLHLESNPLGWRRHVNFAPAEPLYPGFLTPKDLIRFIGKAKGASHIQEEFLLEKFKVTEFFHKPFKLHSSGMLKKVSIVVSFLGYPRLILLDEPFTTLDVATRITLTDQIKERRKKGIIFLLSSHQSLTESALEPDATYFIEQQMLRRVGF